MRSASTSSRAVSVAVRPRGTTRNIAITTPRCANALPRPTSLCGCLTLIQSSTLIIGMEMPYLEDPAAIQIGFMQLIHGVAQELIRPDRAKLILSALHGAALNLRMMEKAEARRERTSVPRTVVSSQLPVVSSEECKEAR